MTDKTTAVFAKVELLSSGDQNWKDELCDRFIVYAKSAGDVYNI